jgi:tRNA pseudouridine65 synthase
LATDDHNENKTPTLPIIYRDAELVAIDKPSGLLVHRSALDASENQFALQILRDQIGQNVYPCHRLDKPTGGVLLFALNAKALKKVQQQFTVGSIRKVYHALVRGWVETSGCIDYALRHEEHPNKVQSAVTDYRCLGRSVVTEPLGRYTEARFSLVELKPRTGRKHQLRRHMAHLRHPILGDTRHGDGAQNRFLRSYCKCHSLMLRATTLELEHPSTRIKLCLKAEADPVFQRVAKRLKLV